MTGGTGAAPSIFDQDPPKIVGDQSAFSDVLAAAGSAVSKLESIASRLDGFLADNQASVTNTTKNVEAFTGALAENAEDIKSFLASVSELSTPRAACRRASMASSPRPTRSSLPSIRRRSTAS